MKFRGELLRKVDESESVDERTCKLPMEGAAMLVGMFREQVETGANGRTRSMEVPILVLTRKSGEKIVIGLDVAMRNAAWRISRSHAC